MQDREAKQLAAQAQIEERGYIKYGNWDVPMIALQMNSEHEHSSLITEQ